MNKNKSTIDWLMIFTKDHRSFYIVSVILAILGVICSIVPYMIIGDMATKLINGNKDFQIYLNETMIMCLFWILRIAFHSLSTLCPHTATFRVLAHIRKLVCDKLTIVPLGKIKDESSGTLKNVIVERIDSIETTLAHVVPEFTANLMAPVIVTIYLFIIDWRIALAALIIMPLGFLAYCGMMIGYEESFRNTITKTKILNDTAVEYINGIEVIKAFGKAQNSYEKFKIAAQEGADCYIEWMRRSNIFFSIAMVLTPCTMLTVLPISGYFVMNQTLSIIDFIMCIILSLGLTVPIITVASYSDDIGKMTAIADEVVNILTWEPLDRPTHSQESPSDYSIQLDKVTFAYNDIDVLHDICMNIKQGTFNAFVGPSGSGKSTIAKLIVSLWDVKKGNISIGGINIKDLSLEDCNQMIAYVSQDNYLFHDSIKENIRMGNPDASDNEVFEAAKRSGCHDFIMELENGYDTVCEHLSGGEKQRIAIARAMLKNAPIIILDEATAYTDPENEAIIQQSVAKLVQNKTLIVIAHRLSTITDADQLFVINNGKIEEIGKHQEILKNNQLYAKMWASHISIKDGVIDA